jgi:hemin uptake protein HemP
MSAVNPDVDTKSASSESKAADILRWTTKVLFAGAREIIIEHAGVEYRLRLTSQDKLILTK